MKLITLNTHSLVEADYPEKLRLFAEAVLRERPDVIALQEVNQSRTVAPVDWENLEESGFVACGEVSGESEIPVRRDNHAYRLAELLGRKGNPYFWSWVPAKVGYGKYDEGTALFCRFPILEAKWFYSTGTRDYEDWKTRKVLGICVEIEGEKRRFFSVHMGWWGDETEPFEEQWKRIEARTKTYAGMECWLMGDFNAPAHVKGEGYQLVRESGWFDTYDLARSRDTGFTVRGSIDGWREGAPQDGMRIDYIWVNRRVSVRRSAVVFDGNNYPIVSDHFGVMAECEPAERAQEGEQKR